MTRTEFVPGRPSPAQAQYLAEAVLTAYSAGWKGSIRETMAPRLRRRRAPRPTRIALRSKGLLEMAGGRRDENCLTKYGIAAGEAAYSTLHGITARERAEALAEDQRKRDQKLSDRVNDAKRYFRGLTLARKRYGKGSKKVSDHITGERLELTLDDLLSIGEQIEKLR